MSFKHQGFVLVMTLLMLVISMLVLTCLQEVWIYHQALNSQAEQHQSFYHEERLAMQLAKQDLLNNKGDCVIDGDHTDQIWLRLKEHLGCIIKVDRFQYRYLVEDLGDFPCLMVLINHKQHMTHHHRISIVTDSSGLPTSLLQIHVIHPILPKTCEQKPFYVKLGVSSWRYLIKIG